jgi:hypothetical protein
VRTVHFTTADDTGTGNGPTDNGGTGNGPTDNGGSGTSGTRKHLAAGLALWSARRMHGRLYMVRVRIGSAARGRVSVLLSRRRFKRSFRCARVGASATCTVKLPGPGRYQLRARYAPARGSAYASAQTKPWIVP